MRSYRLYEILTSFLFITGLAYSETSKINPSSKISSVKLYTNKAEITRSVNLRLKRGLNRVLLDSLPDNLYDWSAKGTLPSTFKGKIMSLEVSKKALLEKRRKKILIIESKLEKLRDEDAKLADDLGGLKGQENFLNSISNFSEKTAAKELATRMPNIKVWSNTALYISKNKRSIQASKRLIQKKRKTLAKKIQKLEFDLNQIAGRTYYNTYLQLNQAMDKNTKSFQVQQYGNVARQYEDRNRYLTRGTSGIATEKRILLSIYSATEKNVKFKFSYIIPGTYWNMMYDFRASKKNKNVEVIVYSNIYQKTGEDWKNISLSLSTGAPLNNIRIPTPYPWYLNARRDYTRNKRLGSSRRSDLSESKIMPYKKSKGKSEKEYIPTTSIARKGLNFEIGFPLRQTIESSNKYQKKYLKSFNIKKDKNLKFFYKIVPSRSSKAYLMARAVNSTTLPWLYGSAQIFLENEFIGKTNIAQTPIGKKREMVLGLDPSITTKKELVKKYEEKSGLLGGNRKIIYSYQITLENNSREKRNILLLDNFPVSRTSKIETEIKNLSHKFMYDEKIKKSSEYLRGIRKFDLNMNAGEKIVISYDAVITFDKKLKINGLK